MLKEGKKTIMKDKLSSIVYSKIWLQGRFVSYRE